MLVLSEDDVEPRFQVDYLHTCCMQLAYQCLLLLFFFLFRSFSLFSFSPAPVAPYFTSGLFAYLLYVVDILVFVVIVFILVFVVIVFSFFFILFFHLLQLRLILRIYLVVQQWCRLRVHGCWSVYPLCLIPYRVIFLLFFHSACFLSTIWDVLSHPKTIILTVIRCHLPFSVHTHTHTRTHARTRHTRTHTHRARD